LARKKGAFINIPESIMFCTIEELKRQGSVTKYVDEWRDEISAFVADRIIFVLSSICPHFGGPLKAVKGTRKLRCDWHSWEFDLETGRCKTFPFSACLRHYPFEEKGQHLEVFLHEGA